MGQYDAPMTDPSSLSDEEYGKILEHRERQRQEKEFRLSRTLIGTGLLGAAAGLLAGGPLGIVVALAMVSTFTAAGVGKRKQTERMQQAHISQAERVRVQRLVDGLVAEGGMEQPTVVISPSKSMNAMAMKIFANRRGTIQVNEGILSLPDSMLHSVLAHELTHYAHRDSRTLVPFALSRLGVSLMQRSMILYAILTGWGAGMLPWVPGVVGSVTGALLTPLFIGSLSAGAAIGAAQNIVSRRLEKRADAMLPAFTARNSHERQYLALALTVLAQKDFAKAVSRLHTKESSTPRTSRRRQPTPQSQLRSLRAALHTSDMAFTDRIESFFTMNHPPTQDRIANLLEDSTRLVPRATVRRVATPNGAHAAESYEYRITVEQRAKRSNLRQRMPFLRRTALPGGAQNVAPPVAQYQFIATPKAAGTPHAPSSHALD